MAKNKEEKTNVVRILEAAGIPCTAYEVPLPKGKVPGGRHRRRPAGQACGAGIQDPGCPGPQEEHFVYVIPRGRDPGFEKAARAAGVKSVSMLPKSSCSPHRLCPRGLLAGGDVQSFPTYFAEEVILVDTMICSAGKVGYQVEVAPTI